jgi:hypothetical protein
MVDVLTTSFPPSTLIVGNFLVMAIVFWGSYKKSPFHQIILGAIERQ